ncbi:hypothetical protein MHYP_G00150320 [Metynnis hypsauchen]
MTVYLREALWNEPYDKITRLELSGWREELRKSFDRYLCVHFQSQALQDLFVFLFICGAVSFVQSKVEKLVSAADNSFREFTNHPIYHLLERVHLKDQVPTSDLP